MRPFSLLALAGAVLLALGVACSAGGGENGEKATAPSSTSGTEVATAMAAAEIARYADGFCKAAITLTQALKPFQGYEFGTFTQSAVDFRQMERALSTFQLEMDHLPEAEGEVLLWHESVLAQIRPMAGQADRIARGFLGDSPGDALLMAKELLKALPWNHPPPPKPLLDVMVETSACRILLGQQ